MCCDDCGSINPDYTHIDYVMEAIEAFESHYLNLNIAPYSHSTNGYPEVDFGKEHTAEEDIYQCLISLRSQSTFWKGVLNTLKSRNVKIKIVEVTNPDDPLTYDPEAADSVAWKHTPNPQYGTPYWNQTVEIRTVRLNMLEAAKTMGVTYAEAYAEAMVHETLHVYYAGSVSYHGNEVDQGYMDNEVVEKTHTVYAQVFSDAAPEKVWWAGGLMRPPSSNNIPNCLQNVINGEDDFHQSIESARSAVYMYPTYRLQWREGAIP